MKGSDFLLRLRQYIFLLLLLPLQMYCQNPVTLSNTNTHTITSSILPDREFILYTGLPENYEGKNEKLPVLYFLDAYDKYGMILQIYRMLYLFGEVPPMLIVGISYPGSFADYLRLRCLDFMPSFLSGEQIEKKYGKGMTEFIPASGGAADFLRVLAEEIIPYIEKNYNVDPGDRGIFGYSAGGLFTAYVLFNQPNLFQRYLIGSSAVWWNDFAVMSDEENYYKTHKALNAKVLISCGSNEGDLIIGGYEKLKGCLADRKYTGLSVSEALLDGETHVSGVARTYTLALKLLYNNKQP